MFISGARSHTEDGEEILINCPACGARQVKASTYAKMQRVRIAGIPIDQRTSWVVCSACRKHLLSLRDVNDLPCLSEDELGQVLSVYTSFISRSFAVLALILGWIPIVGLVIAVLAVLLNRRRSIWRMFSWIGFVLGAVLTGLFVVALFLGW
jgi:hypothetical protein